MSEREAFTHWERETNELMIKIHGVGIDDIPDMAWFDWFQDDTSPERAVRRAIAIVNEGGF